MKTDDVLLLEQILLSRRFVHSYKSRTTDLKIKKKRRKEKRTKKKSINLCRKDSTNIRLIFLSSV